MRPGVVGVGLRRLPRRRHPLIRTAEEGDLGAIRELFVLASLSNAGDRLVLVAHPDALEFDAAPVAEGRTRVAVDDHGRVVGFATVARAGGTAELEDLFVDPARMRQGIGRALVLDAVARLRAQGAERLEVTANPHAVGFYARMGFVAAGEAETRFGPAPRMWRAVGRSSEG